MVSESPVTAQGQAYVSAVNSWITGRLKERSQIQKQARLCREEFGGRGKGGKKFGTGEDYQDGGSSKWKNKKKKADGSGGATGSAGDA